MVYRSRAKHQAADAQSRTPTTDKDVTTLEDAFPTLAIEATDYYHQQVQYIIAKCKKTIPYDAT